MSTLEMFNASVGNFGFPLVLSIYLLARSEKKIDGLTEAIYELKQVIKNEK
ncbi:YvrJ family protein [Priestia megaterium]|uniref:YvrJ family protein n=1 Tax=Priestia megaterium TaxID=1404 RepID=UPI000BF739D1|nr:YvrJ family protein [Priestia megaterium]PEZ06122.1 YvrJ family protein [Priestia megaterium]